MISSRSRMSRVAQAIGAAALLVFIHGASSPAAAQMNAAQLTVGDHWQYRITDNLRRGAQGQLDVEVTDVNAAQVARIRLVRTDSVGRTEWVDEVDGRGGLRSGSLNREPARPFDPAAELLAFPLDKGKTWRQTINTLRKDTGLKDQILIYGKVTGRASIAVPAGTFETIDVYRTVQLDDAEFWRTRTTRRDTVWYAPVVKAPVREKHEGEYIQRDAPRSTVRTESTVFDLVSFRPGAR